ncbi:methylated-DNA--[protein]-cysteine S-methyltransferase [Streptomyces sp. 549]|uniref:methylated-DNA--[protein]-cysteine S-methyltransferase n=1 Tax=Streptomyces sp. 549 TaxID=3049076 RepID=UPI0024C3322D|nr:methylated-DNA--[protein]-cysteine S-methyltransferase [Streptomyces sp. 549]MDK1474176.1 methylated-DNA--[protein]-cysteine S-methyltransferase [Streptomyces sp. 549]
MTDIPAGPPAWTVCESPVGPLLLAATDRGLVRVLFHTGEAQAAAPLADLASRLGAEPVSDPGHPVLATAAAQLEAYFGGTRTTFGIPLDWSLCSGFHARVLRTLHRSVPFGSVIGYRALADRVGEPGAARAVGAAMGANPLPVVVPCHRVVAADGGIGGFGGGVETKRVLLAVEGVLPAALF